MFIVLFCAFILFSLHSLVVKRYTCTSNKTILYIKKDTIFIISLTALRIHCSDDTKQILEELGGYHLEDRGLVQMKVLLFLCGMVQLTWLIMAVPGADPENLKGGSWNIFDNLPLKSANFYTFFRNIPIFLIWPQRGPRAHGSASEYCWLEE